MTVRLRCSTSWRVGTVTLTRYSCRPRATNPWHVWALPRLAVLCWLQLNSVCIVYVSRLHTCQSDRASRLLHRAYTCMLLLLLLLLLMHLRLMLQVRRGQHITSGVYELLSTGQVPPSHQDHPSNRQVCQSSGCSRLQQQGSTAQELLGYTFTTAGLQLQSSQFAANGRCVLCCVDCHSSVGCRK